MITFTYSSFLLARPPMLLYVQVMDLFYLVLWVMTKTPILHWVPVLRGIRTTVAGFWNLNLPTGPPTMTDNYPPAVTQIHTPPQFCERGGKLHLIPLLPLTRSRRRLTVCPHGYHLPIDAAIVNVDPTKRTSLRNSFRAVTDDIAEGLSMSRSAATDDHWEKWSAFCRDVA